MAMASTFHGRRPQRHDGMGRGAMLALLVHAGLLIALAFGVSWRSREPVGSSAELWAAVPQAAAPAAVEPLVLPKPMPTPAVKAVEPPPPPRAETRDADIAVEKAKAEKLQRERAEIEQAKKLQQERAERQEREKAEKDKREKAERERREQEQIAKLRDEQLKRIQGQAGATGAPQSTGTAQREAGPSANYAGKIVARVRPNIVLTETVPPTLHAEVEVRIAPDGTITARRLIKSSGNATWDDAVLRAIDRTETLPKDDNGRVPSSMTLVFTPA
jgi:colicin import membrane protein